MHRAEGPRSPVLHLTCITATQVEESLLKYKVIKSENIHEREALMMQLALTASENSLHLNIPKILSWNASALDESSNNPNEHPQDVTKAFAIH